MKTEKHKNIKNITIGSTPFDIKDARKGLDALLKAVTK